MYTPDYDAVWEFSLLSSPIIFYYFFKLFKKINLEIIIKYKSILLPIIILILLSIGPSMRILFNLLELFLGKFPIVDRLPSRIFIYPFSVLFIISIIHYKKEIKLWHILLYLFFLLINSYNWRVDYTLSKIRNDNIILNPKIYSNTSIKFDQNYILFVQISYIFSFIFLFIILAYIYKTKPTNK